MIAALASPHVIPALSWFHWMCTVPALIRLMFLQLDLRAVEQLCDIGQTRSIAEALAVMSEMITKAKREQEQRGCRMFVLFKCNFQTPHDVLSHSFFVIWTHSLQLLVYFFFYLDSFNTIIGLLFCHRRLRLGDLIAKGPFDLCWMNLMHKSRGTMLFL